MDVEINHLAVLLAALSAMAVGSLWYSPAGFYRQWARLTKVPKGPDISGVRLAVVFASVFVASWVLAYVLAAGAFIVNHFFQNSFIQDAIALGLWGWLGFVVTRFYVHDTFETRPRRLTILNSAHEGVTILVMALVIGLMGY